MRAATTYDDLIKGYYGGRHHGHRHRHRHRQASDYGKPYRGREADKDEHLLANYYGHDRHAHHHHNHGHEHEKQLFELASSVEDGETLGQAAGPERFEEYVVAASLGNEVFEEYVVDQVPMADQASLCATWADQPVDPQTEYLVDVADPLGRRGGANRFDPEPRRTAPPTPEPTGKAPPTPVAPAGADAPSSPLPPASPTESGVQSTPDDDFISDMKSILARQKVYDPLSKKMVDADKLGQAASAEPRQDQETSSSQAIFDKIAKSMQYANAYDLGTVEMENRFADFDRISDLQQKADSNKRAGRARTKQAKDAVAVATAVDSQDFVQDLDEMHHQRHARRSDDDPFAYVPPDDPLGAQAQAPGAGWTHGAAPGVASAGAGVGAEGGAPTSMPGIQIPEIRMPTIQIPGLPVPESATVSSAVMPSSIVTARPTYARDFEVIEPFAEQAYGPQMVFDRARNQDLTDAISTVKSGLSTTDQQRLDKVAFCIAKLGTDHNPVEYAGVKENDMFFSGSLLKVALLYASFELRARLNKLGITVASDWTPFLTAVRSAIPWITGGEEREMKISEAMAFNTSDSGAITFDLRENHRADLGGVFEHQLQSSFAQRVVHRLGYSWINGALAHAGFLDLKTKKGIWFANDIGAGWRQFHVPVSTGGKSSEAMTAVDMANLLTAMHRGTLIDAASGRDMMAIMGGGGSWLSTLTPAARGSLSFVSTGAKVGHEVSADAKVPSVKSEALFIEHRGTPFVAVWQNYPDASPNTNADIINVYRVIDEVVKKWP